MAALRELPMQALVEHVLPFRSTPYKETLCEKMLSEGIAAPTDLLNVSKKALETKLANNADFTIIEMGDAISLRQSIDTTGGNTRFSKPSRQHRSRSPPRRGRSRSYHRPPPKEKPELWAACAKNNGDVVQYLLTQGKDPEEKFEGWSPLMKAAEEGALDALRLLLEKKVDIESSNRKGRTALSFAAAPSMNNEDRRDRPTPTQVIRVLLENGADPKHKCERGMTPKDYAVKAKRDEAIAIFEEFNC